MNAKQLAIQAATYALAILAWSIPDAALAQGPGGGGTPTEAPIISGPSTDADGTYTISWTSVAHGVYYKVEVNPSSGIWTHVPHSAKYSANISGNPEGTYLYRVKGCVGAYCGPWSDIHYVGVGSNPVIPEPESYADQLEYQYEARTGDFDGNGYPDILIDRLTPGGVDGSMQTVIIEGGATGASVAVPTPSELSSARTYPTDPDITLGGSDKNFDGFADLLITGLGALGSPAYPEDSLILYASAKVGFPQPMGLKFIDEEFTEFFGNIAHAFADPSFYIDNTHVDVRPVYGVQVYCPFQFYPYFQTSLWNCQLRITIVDFDVQVSGSGYHPSAPMASSAINAINSDDYSDGDPWKLLSQRLKPFLGVNSFGYLDNGTREPTNYHSDNDEINDEFEQMWAIFLDEIMVAIEDAMPSTTPPEEWPRHDYDVDTVICSTTSNTVYNEGPVGPMGPPAIRTIPASICTLQNVWCWAKRQPAPRQDDQDVHTAQDGGDETLVGGNPLVTWVDDNARTYINQTLSGHILHDPLASPECADVTDLTNVTSIPARCSYVQRQVLSSGTDIKIATHGEGHNPPLMDMANEAAGDILFSNVDQWIRRRLATDGACTDDP